MVNNSRNGVDGGYSILAGVEPNNAARWGQSGGWETDPWQVYQEWYDSWPRFFSVRTSTAKWLAA